jgi:peptidylprolyl isomerase
LPFIATQTQEKDFFNPIFLIVLNPNNQMKIFNAFLFTVTIFVLLGCAQTPIEESDNEQSGIYSSKEECETAENCECAFVMCDYIPEEMTPEEACPPGSTGWTCIDNYKGADIMKVEQGNTIKVEYVGTLPESGEVFDKSEGRGPLEFVAGSGQMIKGFDEAVIGMALDEEKTITIPPEKAYGTIEDSQKIEAPVSQIADNGEVSVGMTVYTNTGMQGTIIKIENDIATIQFVHPLAGKTLQFWIKIVEIQK